MRLTSFILFFFFASYISHAQSLDSYALVFCPAFGHSGLVLNDSVYTLNSGDSIRFETLRFYVSAVELGIDDKIVWKEENSFHLVDAFDKMSLQIMLANVPAVPFNKIKFNVGIDSTTNVSGVMGGDLDPTKGMYWTWQSGYINFKLEGKSNVCKSRNNEFQFHLGGYQSPYNSCQTVILKSTEKKSTVIIDLEKMVNDMNLSNENHIMSPCNESVLLSKKVAGIFSTTEQ
jgi:hypothetical protein